MTPPGGRGLCGSARRWLRFGLTLVGAWVVAAGAVTGSAQASTVSSVDRGGSYGIRLDRDITVAGQPGEANRFVVDVGARVHGVLTVRDTGAVLGASGACVSVDAHTAQCERPITTLEIDGGDGDDSIQTRGFQEGPRFPPQSGFLEARVLGGAGDDRLVGRMLDGASGGPGDDTILARGRTLVSDVDGGPGRDRITAARGYTVLEGDGDGRDVIDAYHVSFEARSGPVRVDLRRGRASDGDRLRSVGFLEGGRGNDTLLGSARPEMILGGRGDDRIDGRGGNDMISSDHDARWGTGADRLNGGAGNDTVWSTPNDRVHCDTGDDVAYFPFFRPLPVDCERRPIGFDHSTHQPLLDGRTLIFATTYAPNPTNDPSNRLGDAERISVSLHGSSHELGRLHAPKRARVLRLVVSASVVAKLQRGRNLDVGCQTDGYCANLSVRLQR